MSGSSRPASLRAARQRHRQRARPGTRQRCSGSQAVNTCSLIDCGLIEVWEAPVGVGEGGLMLPDLAMDAVSKHENWWRYDPEENWDPGEDLTRYAGLAGASSRGR